MRPLMSLVGLSMAFVLLIASTVSCSGDEEPSASLERRDSVVTFVGDSNTQAWAPAMWPEFPFGWGVERDEQYPYRLLSLLEPDVEIAFRKIEPWSGHEERSPATDKVMLGDRFAFFNAGVAGDSSADLRDNWDVNVEGRDSDLIVLCAGTNDMLYERPIADVQADIDWMANRATAAGASLILCTIPPWDEASESQRLWIREFNTWLREHAEDQGYLLADFNRVLDPDQDGNNDFPLDADDTLHVNAEGHQRMADAIPMEAFEPLE